MHVLQFSYLKVEAQESWEGRSGPLCAGLSEACLVVCKELTSEMGRAVVGRVALIQMTHDRGLLSEGKVRSLGVLILYIF